MSIRLLTDADGSARPDIWVDRLQAFMSALGAVDADESLAFCEQAWDIWESVASSDLPAESHPDTLIVLGVRQALASVMAAAYRSTIESRKPMPLAIVHASLIEELNAVRRECDRWRTEGLPSAAEVRARSAIAATGPRVTVRRSA
ncbi:hypothetical protein ACTXG7_20140 [Mycolicibacterium sp. Dal123E01]|uniref:hypothetical protein n=1 Tax=Mycolicibacterium sp. Dal123E01 TaxID=3457578 RepID=UPI00403E4669